MNTKFKTTSDFRKSLEARLQTLATKTGMDLQRLRRKVAFDRFLARIFTQEKPGFFLKGGYAMELRILSIDQMLFEDFGSDQSSSLYFLS